MSRVFLFPGQGSQFVGMGNDLLNSFPEAAEIYQQANDLLEINLSEMSFNGPEDVLKRTEYTQPAIFVHSIIVDKIIKQKGLHPTAVAGHSLGEFSAFVSAGVLTFEDALNIVKVRSREMAKAGENNPGTMAAILGADNDQISQICNQNDVVQANINAPGQTVISGEIQAIDNAIETAKSIGIRRAIRLNVSSAFHSPLMSVARVPLSKVLDSVNFMDANIPVYQNVTAKPVINAVELKTNALKQLESPVLWSESITNMNHDGYNHFIEIGPGKVLHSLNRRILKDIQSESIGNVEQLNNYAI